MLRILCERLEAKAYVTEFGSQASKLVEYWKQKKDCQATKQRSLKHERSFLRAALQLYLQEKYWSFMRKLSQRVPKPFRFNI